MSFETLHNDKTHTRITLGATVWHFSRFLRLMSAADCLHAWMCSHAWHSGRRCSWQCTMEHHLHVPTRATTLPLHPCISHLGFDDFLRGFLMTGSTLVNCDIASRSLSAFVINRLWSIMMTLVILYNRCKVVSDNSIQKTLKLYVSLLGGGKQAKIHHKRTRTHQIQSYQWPLF